MSAVHALGPLSAVFAVKHGSKLDFNKMKLCKPSEGVAFVGRSGEGCGVVGFVRPLDTLEAFPAGLITVALGGAALSSFVQPRPFYTAQNIDVLRPLSEMSLDEKLYYCLCIQANRFRYSTYGREANRTLRGLLVPSRGAIPKWVHGSAERAAESLIVDLKHSIGNNGHVIIG